MSALVSVPFALFNVAKDVYLKSLEVKRFREDCTKLAAFIERAEGFLLEIEKEEDMNGPGWQAAFTALHEAFVEAAEIMEDCAKFGMIRSLINADDMTHRFHTCTQRLQLALQMIPIQKQKVTDEKMAAMRDLMYDMHKAQFTAARQAQVQSARLTRLMDQSRVDAGKTHDMLAVIMDMLHVQHGGVMSPEEKAAVQQEMDDLREELQQSRRLKRTVEEQYITQIMGAIEEADEVAAAAAAGADGGATSSSSRRAKAAAASPPKSLTCPISCQLFRDPVILVESGQTYERGYIEEWLGRGNMKDPLSGQVISSSMLCPNMAVKSMAQEWLAQHADYKEPEPPPPAEDFCELPLPEMLSLSDWTSGGKPDPEKPKGPKPEPQEPNKQLKATAGMDRGSTSAFLAAAGAAAKAGSCKPGLAAAAGGGGLGLDEIDLAKQAYRRALATAAAGAASAAPVAVYHMQMGYDYSHQNGRRSPTASAAAGAGGYWEASGAGTSSSSSGAVGKPLLSRTMAGSFLEGAGQLGADSGVGGVQGEEGDEVCSESFVAGGNSTRRVSFSEENAFRRFRGGATFTDQERCSPQRHRSVGSRAYKGDGEEAEYDDFNRYGYEIDLANGMNRHLQKQQQEQQGVGGASSTSRGSYGNHNGHGGGSSDGGGGGVREEGEGAGGGGGDSEVTLQDFRKMFWDMRNARETLTMKYGPRGDRAAQQAAEEAERELEGRDGRHVAEGSDRGVVGYDDVRGSVQDRLGGSSGLLDSRRPQVLPEEEALEVRGLSRAIPTSRHLSLMPNDTAGAAAGAEGLPATRSHSQPAAVLGAAAAGAVRYAGGGSDTGSRGSHRDRHQYHHHHQQQQQQYADQPVGAAAADGGRSPRGVQRSDRSHLSERSHRSDRSSRGGAPRSERSDAASVRSDTSSSSKGGKSKGLLKQIGYMFKFDANKF